MKCIYSLILSLILFSLNPEIAISCQCTQPPSAAGSVEQSDVVFVGKVVAGAYVDQPPGGGFLDPPRRVYTFRIAEVFKGTIDNTIEIITAPDEAACGYNFNIGGDYIVYARGTGPYRTGMCSGTKEYLPYGKKEAEAIRGSISKQQSRP